MEHHSLDYNYDSILCWMRDWFKSADLELGELVYDNIQHNKLVVGVRQGNEGHDQKLDNCDKKQPTLRKRNICK
jgi:hypothetical protein